MPFLRYAVSLVLFASPCLAQTTWYVDAAGAAPGSGTELDPYTAIQFAIDQPATVSGDTIQVGPGEYVENLFVDQKNLVIESEEGPTVTTIRAAAPGHVITFQDSLSELTGFTITGGVGVDDAGVAILPQANVTVMGNVIHHNGKGIFNDYDAALRSNTIVYNGLGIQVTPLGIVFDDPCNLVARNTINFEAVFGFNPLTCAGSDVESPHAVVFGDPLFWDEENGDFHLRPDTPMVGTFPCLAGGCTEMGALPFDPSYNPDTHASYCFGDGGFDPACTPCPCANDAPLGSGGGCLNSTGFGSRLIASGSASVGADTLRMEVRDMTPQTAGTLFSGDNRLPANPQNPCHGFASGLMNGGDGLRCMGGNLRRHGARASNAAGEIGVTTPGWGAPDGPLGGLIGQGAFVAGQTRHFQVFHRDDSRVNCGEGYNTTQGRTVTFRP